MSTSEPAVAPVPASKRASAASSAERSACAPCGQPGADSRWIRPARAVGQLGKRSASRAARRVAGREPSVESWRNTSVSAGTRRAAPLAGAPPDEAELPPSSSPSATTAAATPARIAPVALLAVTTLLALLEVDDQRHAVHVEPLAQPVLDEVGVVARHPVAAVDLDREARRARLVLGHVEQPQPRALLGRRLALLDDLAEEAVELRRRDPLAPPVAEDDRVAQEPLDVAAADRRRREHLRSQTQLLADAGALVVEVGLLERGDVPLVEDERRRTALLHRQLGDAQVLGRDAVVGVADDQRDVGALDRALGAQGGVVLDRLGDLRLPAHAGGVDDHQAAAVDLEREVDRVARRARDLGDDHALAAQEAVDQRRLADVRATDDREADDVVVLLLGLALGEHVDDPVQQVPGPEPLGGGDRLRIAEPEAVEVGGQRHVADVVDLVGGEDDRLGPAAQEVGELLVPGPGAGARVDDQDGDLGVVERRLGLLADRAGHRVVVEHVHAAGVDQREAAPVPLGRDLVAVARDAGARMDHRLARARQPVDERRLADVGIADDGDLHRLTSSTIRCTTSSTDSPVVSTETAPGAGSSVARPWPVSRSSRSRSSSTPTPRRSARSWGEAVRYTFTSASGATTVAMSRPSATQSPPASMSRCFATSTSRTAGSAARRDASWATSGVRIASLTSSPSRSTRSPSKRMSSAAGSRPDASATERYMAPVSRYV